MTKLLAGSLVCLIFFDEIGDFFFCFMPTGAADFAAAALSLFFFLL